jgi:hypothetical protein
MIDVGFTHCASCPPSVTQAAPSGDMMERGKLERAQSPRLRWLGVEPLRSPAEGVKVCNRRILLKNGMANAV